MMYVYECRVLKVVDGDTLHLDVDLGCDVRTRLTVRLAEIDTPETGTPRGVQARQFVHNWVVQHSETGPLTLRTIKDKREKYGRYLGRLFGPDPELGSLNQALLNAGLATPYPKAGP